MSRLIMFEDISRPIMFEDISRPIMFVYILRPIIFPILLPIVVEDMSLPMGYIVWPMVFPMLLTIMLEDMSWPIMSEDLYMFEDIWLFLCIMLFMDISCPNMLFGILDLSWVLSLRGVESIIEVILVLMKSDSADGSASASRLINLPVLSAVSLRMWNPWSSAM